MTTYRCGILWIISLLFAMHVPAQQPTAETDHDTTYYESFLGKTITGRLYFSQKYTAFEIKRNNETTPRLRYTPNTNLNMGIGATYRSFTLNLAYGFGFLNRDEEQKGKTKYWENQGHMYGRKWGYDFYAQFYKGYYLYPKGVGSADKNLYYIRPDIKFNLFGLAPFRILNDKKFSYRAAFVQNEWQKRSAGSFLLGAEIYYGFINADSALVPGSMAMLYEQQGIHKIQFFEIGPGAGYAHTFVLAQHFFITGSLQANLNLGWVRETSRSGSEDCFSFTPNFYYRGAAGYNSRSWNVNVSWVSNRMSVRGASSADGYIGRVGIVRATLAKQFQPGPKAKKILKPFDKWRQRNKNCKELAERKKKLSRKGAKIKTRAPRKPSRLSSLASLPAGRQVCVKQKEPYEMADCYFLWKAVIDSNRLIMLQSFPWKI